MTDQLYSFLIIIFWLENNSHIILILKRIMITMYVYIVYAYLSKKHAFNNTSHEVNIMHEVCVATAFLQNICTSNNILIIPNICLCKTIQIIFVAELCAKM